VPLPGTDATKNRLNTGDCNAYIASLLAKASELYGCYSMRSAITMSVANFRYLCAEWAQKTLEPKDFDVMA